VSCGTWRQFIILTLRAATRKLIPVANAPQAIPDLGLAPGKTPAKLEQQLLQRILPQYMLDACHWLILPDSYVGQKCKPLRDRCAEFHVCRNQYKPPTLKV
jgi:endonuclease III